MIRIAVDAMGGDYAPAEMVAGAVDAANDRPDIRIALVGRQEEIQAELSKFTYQ